MRTAPPSSSFAPELPFRYVGGDPSLDLVNTVDWTDRGLAYDRLSDYGRLTRWAEGAAILPSAARLRQAAAARPGAARAALNQARRARRVLQRVFAAVATGAPRRELDEALVDYNELLAETLRHLRLGAADARVGRAAPPQPLTWRWSEAETHLAAPLWPVVWSSAALLASPEAERLRVCGGPDCGWMYVDRSRNGLRRWCQMETCGTREKSRRRAQRLRGATRRV